LLSLIPSYNIFSQDARRTEFITAAEKRGNLPLMPVSQNNARYAFFFCILTSIRGMQKLAYGFSFSQAALLKDFLPASACVSHREGNSIGGPPLLPGVLSKTKLLLKLVIKPDPWSNAEYAIHFAITSPQGMSNTV